MSETLRPQERIRFRKDFIYLYKRGQRYKGKYFILIYLSRELHFSRMAVIVSKKVGNAVKRNKIKRRMRALFRTNKDLLKSSFDLVFIAKREILESGRAELRREYKKALEVICQDIQSS